MGDLKPLLLNAIEGKGMQGKQMHPMRSILLSVLLCSFILWSFPLIAEITPAQRAEDKRLETIVNLTAQRIRIGELLPQLSAKTSVELKINNRVTASGIPLMVSLTGLPLADAMNALCSLLGSRAVKWRWERTGKPNHYIYWLQAPYLEAVAAHLREHVQTGFEQQAATLIKAANMTPEERKQLSGTSKADAAAIDDSRVMNGVKIFGETLPADLQQKILRGEATSRVPVSQLSLEGQSYVKSEYRRSNILNKDPDTVFFHTNSYGDISPTLYMEVGEIGGHGYVGGVPLNKQFQEEIVNDWMQPGDRESDPRTATIVARPKAYQSASVKEYAPEDFDKLSSKEMDAYLARLNHVTAKRLLQLSEATPLPLMAVLPAAQSDIGEPYEKTVAHFIDALHRPPYNLLSKWHNGVLLFSYGPWFLNMDSCVSYDIIQQVREQQRKGQGLLNLEYLAALADSLSRTQLTSLSEEVPVFKNVADARNIFLLYVHFPEVNVEEGALLTPAMVQLLKRNAGIQMDELPQGTRVWIHEVRPTNATTPGSQILFELIRANGKRISGIGIPQGKPFPPK